MKNANAKKKTNQTSSPATKRNNATTDKIASAASKAQDKATTATNGAMTNSGVTAAKATQAPTQTASSLTDAEVTANFVSEIEGKFHNLVSLVKRTMDETNLQTDLALKDLKKSMTEAQTWVSEHGVSFGDLTAKAAEMIDTAKVKAHLAKLDATDLAEPVLARLDRMQAEIRGLNSTVGADLSQMFQRFKQTFKGETRAN